jgi:Xaa-Pro aminopeptidase
LRNILDLWQYCQAGAPSAGEYHGARQNRESAQNVKKLTTPILLIGGEADCPDIEYATGFRAPDAVVFLKTRAWQGLVVPELEKGRAEAACRGLRVWTPGDLEIPRARRGRISEWALALLRVAGLKRVRVAGTFPLAVARRLQRAGIDVQIAQSMLFPERAIKSPLEIARIRQSQQAAVIAMRAATAMFAGARVNRNGILEAGGGPLTSERVRARILEVLFSQQCIARDIIVAGGREAANPHSMGSGPLRQGEAVVIDIFPRHMEHGYWGDLTRTLVKGNPSPELRRMYHAVKTAQAAALACIKPGVKCSTVHRAVVQTFRERGFETGLRNGRPSGFIHSTGHGVGLSIHENPSLGGSDQRLRAGHVVTVEPGLYYPDIGGVRIEDTILVRRGGWQYLVPCEKKFLQ